MMYSRLLKAAAWSAALLTWVPPALAQAPAKVANEEPSYLAWIVFAGAALIICATGFMNSKRSHLN